MAEPPSIYLTQKRFGPPFGSPGSMRRRIRGPRLEKLENELARAVVVPRDQIPKHAVTMNSRVLFENETTGERREITLVYPANADIDSGKISILVPVGTALLGL